MACRCALLLIALAVTPASHAQTLPCAPPADPDPDRTQVPVSTAMESSQTECKLRVLVAYTHTAASLVGDPHTHAQAYVDYFNVANALSGVNWAVELAAVPIYTYTQTGLWNSAGLSIDLERFRNNGDGWLDVVHADRAIYDADICLFVTENPILSFGVEYGGSAYTIGATNAADAFIQIWWQNSVATLAHECGHILGLRHGSDPTTTPYPYGHGFSYSSPFVEYQTIMGGAASCSACPQIQRWSSDDLLYGGAPLGNASFADAARALRESYATASTWTTTPGALLLGTTQVVIDGEFADAYSEGTIWVFPGTIYRVFSGGTVHFRGQTRITLSDGFRAYEGSEFRAWIVPPCAPVLARDERTTATVRPAMKPSQSEVAMSVHPVPFSSETQVLWFLEQAGRIDLRLLDETGRVRQSFVRELAEPGPHAWSISGSGLASGVYHIVGRIRDQEVRRSVIVVH